MYDIDYSKWADYIEEIFNANVLKPKLILDLGCGTGEFSIEMARRGYDVIGLDVSSDMLSCARDKAESAGVDILFLNQDMTNFELYGTVDAVVCLMDSMNYITDKRDIKRLFKLVKNYLNPNGLFIFDINSCYKLKKVLGNNVFYEVNDDVSYIWQNSYDAGSGICEFELTFFVKHGDTYRKYDEVHRERAYGALELKEMACSFGIEVLGIYDELSFSKYTEKSTRIFFVCRNESGK